MLNRERNMQIRQQGVILIEALIGILIFSMGILALVAMQSAAISSQSDAQYRVEAANFANKILGEIWLNTVRVGGVVVPASLDAFAHQPVGASSSCNFTGAASTDPGALVATWVNELTTGAGTRLPGATPSMQQIVVDTTAGSFNSVKVTVCWKSPNDTVARRHSVSSNIN
jgi:type IV pilus assembly protein PilV